LKELSFNNKFKGYIDLLRPFTLLTPFIVSISIMIASFFYNKASGVFSEVFFRMIIPSGFCLAVLNAASNILNQATDLATDRISKPYRPIPRGLISVQKATKISFILYAVALGLAFFLNTLFFILILTIAIFTISYSLPPRIKDQLFLNQLWVAIPRGLLGIFASWSLFGNLFEPLPIIIGSIAMLFLIGGTITKDITDKDADKTTGTQTLVNTFGIKKAAFMSLPFLFIPFAFVPLMVSVGMLEYHFMILTLFAIPGYLIFYCMVKDKTRSILFENTKAWSLMYFTYLIFAISFSVLTFLGSIIA
jgi:4-hydroxybenzoate polyprenyltransferase